ncbi:MAG: hypothetical protein GWO24_03180, partial [Akkermansiaceae bacterium]|nr:hypothetical protein [Akkermansiaceae bacterium]
MNVPTSPSEFKAAYPDENLDWMRITGSRRFDYPIDYWVAILRTDPEAGRIDFISRWEPDNYCHYHRHLGETSILVLEGEHHVVETTELETVHKIRRPGFFTTNPGGDLHMEYGGPEGSLVFFSCQAIDGDIFDVV